MGKGKLFVNGVRDHIVLSAIVAAVNYWLDPTDIGWLNLNPTPWLLPGILIGVRYGFTGGVLIGLATPALIAFVISKIRPAPMEDTLRDHPYFFVSLVIAAVISGEVGAMMSRRYVRLKKGNTDLTDENIRLRSQLNIVLETRMQLQQELAVFNAPLCALDDELKTLFSYSQEEFAEQLLRSLHRLTGLTSAGIYVVNGSRLDRSAVLHPTPQLKERLALDETPLAGKAVTTSELASVPDATQLNDQQPFLAAFPWLDHLGRTSVLLIHDMPFEAFTMNNLARLELILTWASAMAVLRRTFTDKTNSDHTVPHHDFRVLLDEALVADRIHGLPSAVLRFDFTKPGDVRAALRLLPATALATRTAAENAIIVMLPFSGETEANELTRRLTAAIPGLRGHHYLITGTITGEALWEHLMKP